MSYIDADADYFFEAYGDRAEDEFPTGDPRRCPHHPHVTTSSNDGMFDAPCGECEHEMEQAAKAEEYATMPCPCCGTIGCHGGAACPDEPPPAPVVSRTVVAYRMGAPVYLEDIDDDVPF